MYVARSTEVSFCDSASKRGVEIAVTFPIRFAGEIAAALGVNSAAAVKMVSRLESKGLVRRRTDDWDRRLTKVSLTDAGKEAVRLFGAIQQSDKSK